MLLQCELRELSNFSILWSRVYLFVFITDNSVTILSTVILINPNAPCLGFSSNMSAHEEMDSLYFWQHLQLMLYLIWGKVGKLLVLSSSLCFLFKSGRVYIKRLTTNPHQNIKTILKSLVDTSPLKALPVPLTDWIHTCLRLGRKPFREWKAFTSPASVWFAQLGINLSFRPVYQVEKYQTKLDENLTPNLAVAQNPNNLHGSSERGI